MALATTANAKSGPANLAGAEFVKAVCKQREDHGRTNVRAKAVSWEADGTGDQIKPKWVDRKVTADSVKVMGKAKYIAGETFYAFIGNDCSDDTTPEGTSSLGGVIWQKDIVKPSVQGVIWHNDITNPNLQGVIWNNEVQGVIWHDGIQGETVSSDGDFDVEFGDDGFANFSFEISDFVASDLISE